MQRSAFSKPLTWLILAAIGAIQLIAVLRLHPTNLFGWSGDDTLYFTSAKALAEGKGYVLPSIPGTPRATKYPILYPWLLSWVWRWNPAFPSNLPAAMAVNISFGIAFVVATFLLLRRMKGISDTGALLVTALSAVHPIVLSYEANLTTDIPFAAITVTAIWLTSKSLDKSSGLTVAFFSGFSAGLTMLMRVLGLPIVAGLLLAQVLRGGPRKLAAFVAGGVPFFVTFFVHSISSAPVKPIAYSPSSVCAGSWQLTWIYFTSYWNFWKASAIENHAFWSFVNTNTRALVYQIGAYFIDLRQIRITPWAIVLFVIVLLIAVRGLIRQVEAEGLLPAHLALSFYLVPVLIWDWPNLERFLIPFLPIIIAGAWIEASHIAKALRESFKQKRNMQAWFATAVCAISVIAIVTAAGITWWRAIVVVADLSAERSALLADKREAYQWLRERSAPDARIIAYEAVSAFLYSNRQGISPTVLLPCGKYQQDVLDAQSACLLAPAQPIAASYWIVADDDFHLEWPAAAIRERASEKKLEASYPLLFRAQADHVRIYKLPYSQ